MKKTLLLLLLIVGFSNCKSSKRPKVVTKKSKVEKQESAISTKTFDGDKKEEKTVSKSSQIIDYSKQFLGVRYKWGGTTTSGMDCSGLVHESFKAHQIYLPRISRDMAKKGKSIRLKETLKGDLLFFKTGKSRRNAINHVGLVVNIRDNAIYFIHATTKKGVIISSLNEDYWKSAFTEVRRVL
ncbi:C40 family peptidase [Hyunsoonleella rubra]|uniref:C40 family peptidase n=1 Tax=Hyunsoonleella rubra TaxID=1737062 RepID=A0ABW5TE39_9FLAO